MSEPLHRTLAPLLQALLAALGPELEGPVAFFGHSLGALLAFELVRELRRRGLPLPQVLFVAARGAPHVRFEPLNAQRLADHELLAVVQQRYASIPDEIARDPELLRVAFQPLRADLEIHDAYVYRPEPPLTCPILALGGARDPMVTRDGLEAWREHTTARFATHVLSGSHYFHQEQEASVLRIISSELELRRERTA